MGPDLLKQQLAMFVDVVVCRDVLGAPVGAVALFGPAPAAMRTAPTRSLIVDGDAEHLRALMRLRAIGGTLRAHGVVAAMRRARKVDPVGREQLSDGHHRDAPLRSSMRSISSTITANASSSSTAARSRR